MKIPTIHLAPRTADKLFYILMTANFVIYAFSLLTGARYSLVDFFMAQFFVFFVFITTAQTTAQTREIMRVQELVEDLYDPTAMMEALVNVLLENKQQSTTIKINDKPYKLMLQEIKEPKVAK